MSIAGVVGEGALIEIYYDLTLRDNVIDEMARHLLSEQDILLGIHIGFNGTNLLID